MKVIVKIEENGESLMEFKPPFTFWYKTKLFSIFDLEKNWFLD